MELTIDETLQRGIAAHKEGNLEEAEKLYRSILGGQSSHADANHNLGVLAVGFGRVEQALPLFKLALETNPQQGQFWLSYIDGLLKAGQPDNAKRVLEQGKSSGLTGAGVDDLEARLREEVSSSADVKPSQEQVEGLLSL